MYRRWLASPVCVFAIMLLGAVAATVWPLPLAAETTQPPLRSPETSQEGRTTFRCFAPKAAAVKLNGSWPEGKGVAMARDDKGVWSVTLAALPAGIHNYGFDVDGMEVLDRANPEVRAGIGAVRSMLIVPAATTEFYDYRPDVPHGTLQLVEHPSRQIGKMRRMYVYTPPRYDNDHAARFPVLILCHGYTSNEASWTKEDRAHWIADNLIADGKAKPLIIVMPNCHVKPMPPQATDPDYVNTNAVECDRHIVAEVLPLVESRFRVATGRENRAIAGLSMGADQATYTGLNHPDLFAWVGAFAPGARPRDDRYEPALARITAQGDPRYGLFLLTCGRADGFLGNDTALSARLKKAGIAHEYSLVDGAHTHDVFRANLRDFLPRLFDK